MMNLLKKCGFESCTSLPNYRWPGKPPTRCSKHKEDGMARPKARSQKAPAPQSVTAVSVAAAAFAEVVATGVKSGATQATTLRSGPLGKCPIPSPAADVSAVGAEPVRESDANTPAVAAPRSAALWRAIRAHAVARGARQGEAAGAEGVHGLIPFVPAEGRRGVEPTAGAQGEGEGSAKTAAVAVVEPGSVAKVAHDLTTVATGAGHELAAACTGLGALAEVAAAAAPATLQRTSSCSDSRDGCAGGSVSGAGRAHEVGSWSTTSLLYNLKMVDRYAPVNALV